MTRWRSIIIRICEGLVGTEAAEVVSLHHG